MTTVRELIVALQELPEEALDADVLSPGCCGNCVVDVGLPEFEDDRVYLEGRSDRCEAPPETIYIPSEEELELKKKGLLPE